MSGYRELHTQLLLQDLLDEMEAARSDSTTVDERLTTIESTASTLSGKVDTIESTIPTTGIYHASNYSSFAAAVTAIGSTVATLVVANSQTITASLDVATLAPNTTVVIIGGGYFTGESAVTLNLGMFDAPRRQVFYGLTVTFDAERIECMKPEWWGAKADDSTDNKTALAAACTCSVSSSVPLVLGNGIYKTTDTIYDGAGPLVIKGSSRGNSKIDFVNAVDEKPLIRIGESNGSHLEGFTILGDGNGVAVQIGTYTSAVDYDACRRSTFRDISISNFKYGTLTKAGWINTYDKCVINNCTAGLKVEHLASATVMIGCNMESNTTAIDADDVGLELLGCTIEGNDLGVKIRSGRIEVRGGHYETNTNGHFEIGTETDDDVTSFILSGATINDHVITIDRCTKASIKGITGGIGYGNVKVTSNCKIADLDSMMETDSDYADLNDAAISRVQNSENQGALPIYSCDFHGYSLTGVGTGVQYLDSDKVRITPLNATAAMDTTVFNTGDRSMKFTFAASQGNAGFQIRLEKELLRRNAANQKKFTVWVRMRYNDDITYFYRRTRGYYYDVTPALKVSTVWSCNPTFAGTDLSGRHDEWMYIPFPLDLTSVYAEGDYDTFAFAIIEFKISLSSPAITSGDEEIYIDGFDVWPGDYALFPMQTNYARNERAILHTQELVIEQNRITFGSAAPTAGYWGQGDICFNTGAAASGKVGWVCVTAGIPGTWKTFGAIDS